MMSNTSAAVVVGGLWVGVFSMVIVSGLWGDDGARHQGLTRDESDARPTRSGPLLRFALRVLFG